MTPNEDAVNLSMGRLLAVALVLAVTTGAIHLYLGAVTLAGAPLGLQGPFLGMGLVYLGGVALIAAGIRRGLLIKVSAIWVVVLILAWIPNALAGGYPAASALGYADKAIEVVLLAILAVLVVNARDVPGGLDRIAPTLRARSRRRAGAA